MARKIPTPEGFVGGQPEPSILRTLDGHGGQNVNTDGDHAADIMARSNAKSWPDADLGGDYNDGW